jgi:putative transposase
MVSAQARREQVDYAVSRGASVRRSCALLQVSRSALEYEGRMPARDAELGEALREISAAHPRYGHRFAWGILTRQRQWSVNRKRVRRVWRALGLSVRRKKHRKIRTGQPRLLTPTGPNQVWAYDFVSRLLHYFFFLSCAASVNGRELRFVGSSAESGSRLRIPRP